MKKELVRHLLRAGSADALTPSDLARWMAAPTTTVSSVVKRLERRGHLTRTRNPSDGRSYLLALTPSGRDAHRAAGRLFLPVLHETVAALGRHETAVRRELRRLRDAVEQGSHDA